MARIRNIKPEYFTHERLFELDQEFKLGGLLRLAYAGLWTQSDCRGLFEWRPLRLKLAILPWDQCDFAAILEVLAREGMIVRYESGGRVYGWIRSFSRHQRPHKNELQNGPKHPEPSHLEDYLTCYGPEGSGEDTDKAPAEERAKAPAKDALRSETGDLRLERGNARACARAPGATAPETPPPSSASPPAERKRKAARHPVLDEWAETGRGLGVAVPINGRTDREFAEAIEVAEPDPERRRAVFRLALAEGKPLRFVSEEWAKFSKQAKADVDAKAKRDREAKAAQDAEKRHAEAERAAEAAEEAKPIEERIATFRRRAASSRRVGADAMAAAFEAEADKLERRVQPA